MRELCCASEPTMKALDSVDAAEGAGATSPAAHSHLMLTWPGLQGSRYEQLHASPACRGELHPLKQIHRDIARVRLACDKSMATTRSLVFQALDGVIVCIRCRLTQGNLLSIKALMKAFVGILIRLYRRSPLYPGWGGRLAKLLSIANRLGRKQSFVHDTGEFRMQIDLNQIIDSQIYYTGQFEPNTVATIRQLLSPGAVAVDVGANIGCLTLHMARAVGQGGKVVAFEPTPWAYDKLVVNLGLNPMPQVTAERLGLGDQPIEELDIAIQSSYRLDGKSDQGTTTIQITALDTYFDQHPTKRLDLLKIDTDGMEFAILRGSERVLERFTPALLFEVGPDALRDAGTSVYEMLAWLKNRGYRFYHELSLEPFDDVEAVASKLPPRTSMNIVALGQATNP